MLEKLARGEKRALLSLATGAGKTFIAVNLLKRIADAGMLKRALFVCDRDELRSQGLGLSRTCSAQEAQRSAIKTLPAAFLRQAFSGELLKKTLKALGGI